MINVTVKHECKTEIEFPKLMISNAYNPSKTILVLFECYGSGTVIYAAEDAFHKVGAYKSMWDMGRFEDYNEEVIIKNK